MRILRIKLINYIGIYNGLGLNEIEIDFTRCRYRTVIIRGKNGSGKSTIFMALSPLPDSNKSFIDRMQAEKHIDILHHDIVYRIKFIHGVKNNGDRDTTKAYIDKIVDGVIESLNPNGNVSSFKDILFEEFNLDPNFVSLSQLSSDDRGLADKDPAERKKFVNSIINNLEVYNNIYKTLTKRASVFKSMINNINSKIDNIGDEEKIVLTLSSLENRINGLMSDKEQLIGQAATYKSTVQILDPDGSIQSSYNNIYNEMVDSDNLYRTISGKINMSLNKLRLKEDITLDEVLLVYKEITNNIRDLEMSIQLTESRLNSLLLDRESEAKAISAKTEKLNSLNSERNYIDIETTILDLKEKLKYYESIFNTIGLDNVMNISRDEFIMGLNTVKEIKDVIDTFKSNIEYEIMRKSIDYINSGNYPCIEEIENDIIYINDTLKQKELEHNKYITLKNVTTKLNSRPTNCKINDCLFIKDALDAFNQEPDKNIVIIEQQVAKLNVALANKLKEKKETIVLIEYINYLKVILRNIDKTSMILNKLPIRNIFSDRNILVQKIMNGYDFKEIDVLYGYIEYANIIEEYKSDIHKLNQLENEYKIYQSKNSILEEIIEEISTLNQKLNSITSNIQNNNNALLSDKRKLSELKSMILDYDVLISLFKDRDLITNKKNELISKFNIIKTNITTINECLNGVQDCNNKIDIISKQINPLIQDRDKLKHGLSLLKEYQQELQIYSSKYDKVETIKKYSSPSKGIQTLYMELYMNKTISLANELLSMLFDGEFVIGQYVINDTEFRIPCMGNGMPNDDISSMSTSQVCMISMIISAVLLQQSSTKFNILKLDEIDGGLDSHNRIQFIFALDKLLHILGTEQCIMISHNTEIDLSQCDVIQLKPIDNNPIEGNIIYNYAA